MALIVGGIVALGLNAFAAGLERYNNGQGVFGSALGSLADVTPVSGIYEGMFNQDIVSGENLNMTPEQRASSLGNGLGAVAAMAAGKPAARFGDRMGQFINCFVEGTQVVMAEDETEVIAMSITSDEVLASSDQWRTYFLSAAAVCLGIAGATPFLRKTSEEDERQWDPDPLFSKWQPTDSLPDIPFDVNEAHSIGMQTEPTLSWA